MIVNILLWLALVYIVCVVIWRLVMAIIMIIGGYGEHGWGGAIGMAVISFLMNLWDLAKFAFGLLIIALIIRGCSR